MHGDNKVARAVVKRLELTGRHIDKVRYLAGRALRNGGDGEPGLVFIHHSSGQHWLTSGLEAALAKKDYVGTCTGITYGTTVQPDEGRPGSLGADGRPPGDFTDMDHWLLWFNDYLAGVKQHGNNQNGNRIVLFKSCYPMSNVTAGDDGPGDPFDVTRTLANHKAVFRHPGGAGKTYTRQNSEYKPLNQIFAENPGTLFVAISSPPRHFGPQDATEDAQAQRARHFADWLENDWLKAYNAAHPGLNNVAVFNWFDFLSNPPGHPEHPNRLKEIYGGGTGDSHPNRKADKESTKAFATAPGNPLDRAWEAFNSAQKSAP